jgi:hypothetical protein
MSTKYKHGDVVPTEVLAKRLDELSDAVVSRMNRDNATFEREFTCRIPAELDRDADLVLSESSKRLIGLEKRIAELEEENHTAKAWLATCLFRGIIDKDCLKFAKELLAKRDLEQQVKGLEYHIAKCVEEGRPYSSTIFNTIEDLYKKSKGGE